MAEFLQGFVGYLAACVLLVLLPIGVPALILHTVAARRRRARFAERETLAPADWFKRFMPHAQPVAAELTEVMRPLAREIGIDWTRLRPEDRFLAELALPRSHRFRLPATFERIWPSTDLAHFWDATEYWCERKSLRLDSPEHIQTLGDLLDRVAAALAPPALLPFVTLLPCHLATRDN